MTEPSNEEVEAALAAWRNDWKNGPPEQDERSAMRAALAAAAERAGKIDSRLAERMKAQALGMAAITLRATPAEERSQIYRDMSAWMHDAAILMNAASAQLEPFPIYGATEDTQAETEKAAPTVFIGGMWPAPERKGEGQAMTKLLPCPFCGSEARLRDSDDTTFYIACSSTECFCALGEMYDRDGMPDHVFVERGMAIKAWNTRVKKSD